MVFLQAKESKHSQKRASVLIRYLEVPLKAFTLKDSSDSHKAKVF